MKGVKGVKGGTRWRRKDCDYIIWDVLFDRCGDDAKLKECLEFDLKEYFRKNRFLKGDRTNYLIHAILLVKNSKETLGEVMSNVVELSNLEKEIIDNAIKVTKEIKKDE